MEKKGLLIIKSSVELTLEERKAIKDQLKPLSEALELPLVIVSNPMDATVHYDPAPMIEALKEATKALNAAADRLNVTESGDDGWNRPHSTGRAQPRR